jgi:uncharacterized OsmC-like protein
MTDLTTRSSRSHIRFEAAAAAATPSQVEVELQGGRRLALASDGSLPSPLEVLLGALASCQVLTYQHVAPSHGIALEEVRVEAAGELDPSTLDSSEAPCLRNVVLRVTLRANVDPEQLRELAAAVDRRCPVHATIKHEVRVVRELALKDA